MFLLLFWCNEKLFVGFFSSILHRMQRGSVLPEKFSISPKDLRAVGKKDIGRKVMVGIFQLSFLPGHLPVGSSTEASTREISAWSWSLWNTPGVHGTSSLLWLTLWSCQWRHLRFSDCVECLASQTHIFQLMFGVVISMKVIVTLPAEARRLG